MNIKLKFLTFLLCLFFNPINSQNIENLRLRDTICLIFDEKQYFDDLHLKHQKINLNESYKYVFPDNKIITFITLNRKSVCRKKNLSNLKNKITINDIHGFGYLKTINAFTSKKIIIYLIDKKEKMLLKRVYLENPPNVTF